MIKVLPIIEWQNQKWVVDTRLEEVRSLANAEPISFGDIEDPYLSEVVSELWALAY